MWADHDPVAAVAVDRFADQLREPAEHLGPLLRNPAQVRRDVREQRFLAEGLANRQISEKMYLAEKTVKNYVSALLHKMGLERRTQAAVLATKLLGPSNDGS